ncbi:MULTISPECIES: hypothetical protein [Novosphingobium]|uniref:hypothetical protein n=1 Tax=Novosphingobium TaxID=165696 RepID=UPI00137523E1|nr:MULTISPECIES: hypothetical protein [Novosphingobium]
MIRDGQSRQVGAEHLGGLLNSEQISEPLQARAVSLPVGREDPVTVSEVSNIVKIR